MVGIMLTGRHIGSGNFFLCKMIDICRIILYNIEVSIPAQNRMTDDRERI